jgi:MerR family transcriptional regulator, light-induced transcriptional regulator
MKDLQFTIAAVERDVGLSKDVLRVWERRYGFPSPTRDAHGERLYPAEQVERLRLVKRLLDQGFRPGRLLATPVAELEALGNTGSTHGSTSRTAAPGLDNLLDLVRRHDGEGFLQAAQQRLAREGLQRFVQDTVVPMVVEVGQAWEDGRLQVFEEHLFTELMSRILRQAIAAVPGGTAPRILLTSLPNEQHGMGLLMVEAMLSLEGAHCISLGTQMPLLEIVRAAQAHRVDVVALSFSGAFPARQVPGLLGQLRAALPRAIPLWAGGGGVRKAPAQEGILIMPRLEDAVAAVDRWRSGAEVDARS